MMNLAAEVTAATEDVAMTTIKAIPGQPLLVVIGGPTGSGKTDLAIRLAQATGASIVSADSRQVYREMPIGSAAPTQDQLNSVPHYFIGSHSIHDAFNAGIFAEEASLKLAELFEENPIQIVCGGTGMYIGALVNGIDDLPAVPAEVRLFWQRKLDDEGLSALQAELIRLDKEHAGKIDLQNKARVTRALELITVAGKPISALRGEKKGIKSKYRVVELLVNPDRQELYRRINFRASMMFDAGWEEEARKLYAYRGLKALQTLGYTELFAYFDGMRNREETMALIKQNTRRYAKRQLTWFRNQTNSVAIQPEIETGRLLEIISRT